MKARKSPRVAVQLPVTLCDIHVQGQGTVVNLSVDGCAVLTRTTLPVGSYWTLRIELPQEREALEIELAAVRWKTAERYGMEFIKVRDARKYALQAFVHLLEDPSAAGGRTI